MKHEENFFHDVKIPDNRALSRYRLLLECFHSEQMTDAELLDHMEDDPCFKAFIEWELEHAKPRRPLADVWSALH